MTNDTRTADQIERDIEYERAQMTGTINDLQKKFSVEGMINDVRGMFSEQGGDLGRMVIQTVARNPGAVVLTGIGLAWLLIGHSRDSATSSYDDKYKGGKNGMRNQRTTAERGMSQRRSATNWSDNDPYRENSSGVDSSWLEDDWRTTSQLGIHANTDTSSIVGSVTEKVGDGIQTVTDGISSAATSVKDTVTDLADRFLHGTKGFSDEAKARVKAARQAAYDAKIATQDALQSGGQKATDLFADQPLVVGALAMALGAALGSALPHTKAEDAAMGASSKSLFAEAQRIFAEERMKAMQVVSAVTDEVKSTMSDAQSEIAALVPEAKTAAETLVDRIGGAATRVFDSAKDEAERQGLGHIKG